MDIKKVYIGYTCMQWQTFLTCALQGATKLSAPLLLEEIASGHATIMPHKMQICWFAYQAKMLCQYIDIR